MNVLRSGLVTMLLLAAFSVQAACTWPAWEQFKKDYISQEGRVIDPSDARKITTSEGQSYGMFFALAANDRAAFDNLLDWTQNNLAQGSLKNICPPGCGARKRTVSGKCWTAIRPPMVMSGWPGRCWRRGVCGKSSVIPTSAAHC